MLHEMLRTKRIEHGFTQASMANAIGVDASTYAHYETGRRNPNDEQLDVLYCILDISDDMVPLVQPPIKRTVRYPDDMLDTLEQTIQDCSGLSDEGAVFRLRFQALEKALQPVLDIRGRTLSTKRLERNMPDGGTILSVNLDKRGEELIARCMAKQKELMDFYFENARN